MGDEKFEFKIKMRKNERKARKMFQNDKDFCSALVSRLIEDWIFHSWLAGQHFKLR